LAYLEDKMQMLDLLRKVTAASGFTHASGVEVVAAEVGQVTLDLPKKRELLQFSGFFHGGVIAGLADHSAGAAATTTLAPGKVAVTVDLHINYLAPANGEKLTAIAKCVQSGSTLCVVTVTVSTTSGTETSVCAIASVTLRAVDMPRMP
jgi:uncharacterized protein (TIGR00369 family)